MNAWSLLRGVSRKGVATDGVVVVGGKFYIIKEMITKQS